MAIYGPFRAITADGLRGNPGAHYDIVDRYRMDKPHNMVLPYYLVKSKIETSNVTGVVKVSAPVNNWPQQFDVGVRATGSPMCVVNEQLYNQPEVVRLKNQAVNIARAKFMSSFHDQALIAVNIHERAQAASMMLNRVSQLERFFVNLVACMRHPATMLGWEQFLSEWFKSSSLREKARRLMIDWRGKSRNLGSLWLELHFGWEPLIQDAYNAFEILTTIPQTMDVKVRCPWVYGSLSRSASSLPSWSYNSTFEVKANACVFGTIRFDDVDLYRKQRLGLTNPALWLWEALPYSFVVDWFTTYGEYISQLDEFLGVTVLDAGYSVMVRSKGVGVFTQGGANGPATGNADSVGFQFQRFRGFPGVTLTIRPWKDVSLVRGATAISLLLQQLKSKG